METKGEGPVEDLSGAPLPTARTLRMRKCVPMQFIRFIRFDLNIMAMVVKGHKS